MMQEQDSNKDEYFIPPLDIISGDFTTTTTGNNDGNSDLVISPLLIFFFFLLLDVLIVSAFYFCYFMHTKSKRKEQIIKDKPPPYQIAIMENIYPVVKTPVCPEDESNANELPSYNDTVKNSHNNLEVV